MPEFFGAVYNRGRLLGPSSVFRVGTMFPNWVVFRQEFYCDASQNGNTEEMCIKKSSLREGWRQQSCKQDIKMPQTVGRIADDGVCQSLIILNSPLAIDYWVLATGFPDPVKPNFLIRYSSGRYSTLIAKVPIPPPFPPKVSTFRGREPILDTLAYVGRLSFGAVYNRGRLRGPSSVSRVGTMFPNWVVL